MSGFNPIDVWIRLCLDRKLIVVLLLALMSWRLRLGVERRVLVAAARSTVQLILLGLVLKVLFATTDPLLIGLLAVIMLHVMAALRHHLVHKDDTLRRMWPGMNTARNR